MQMRPEIQIASVIKAMKDVVIPAIDPVNKLAIEQSQLIVGILGLLASQLPVQFRFDCDELVRLHACAEALRQIEADGSAVRTAMAELAAGGDAAALALGSCRLDPTELTASIRALRVAVGNVVTAVAQTKDLNAQLRVEKIVLDMSRDQLLRDRSLVKLQGWEPDPDAVPAIEELLGEFPATA